MESDDYADIFGLLVTSYMSLRHLCSASYEVLELNAGGHSIIDNFLLVMTKNECFYCVNVYEFPKLYLIMEICFCFGDA